MTHEFTLILSGIDELSDTLVDALYEHGCDDGLPGIRDRVVFVDFSREVKHFSDAVLSAIGDVQRALKSIKSAGQVARVEPDEFVTMAEIARRLNRSRQNVQQWAQGKRGAGDFPQPVSGLSGTSPLWRWNEILEWFRQKSANDSTASEECADTIALVNSALELRRHKRSVRDRVLKTILTAR